MKIVVLICLVSLTAGCGEQDASVTVTLEISGISDQADREQVQEKLKGMTDGNSHSMRSNYSGNQMSITLSPVTDVDAFAQKIDFGNVTDVSDRTVKVDFVP